jgi:type VI secretion system ImpM family protein
MNGSGASALCFGKLPSQADFVRFNAAGQEALKMDEWLHQGLYFARTQLGNAWEQEFANAPAHRFIFNPENANRFLAGVMRPSQDKSQRRYPFLASLMLDRHWFREGEMHLVVPACSSFFEGAGQLVQRAMNGVDMRQLADAIQALNCVEPDRNAVVGQYAREFLEAHSVATLWQELFGNDEDPRKYLLFSNLAEVLLSARRKSSRTVSLGLRFPLPGGFRQTDYLVSFWLHVSFIMLDAMSGFPSWFWSVPDDDSRGFLFLFFRQPSPKIFIQLLKPETSNDNICPVDEEGIEAVGKAATSIPASLRTLLDRREGSLGSFLKGLTIALA